MKRAFPDLTIRSGAVFWRFEGDRVAERWPFIDRGEIRRLLSDPAKGDT